MRLVYQVSFFNEAYKKEGENYYKTLKEATSAADYWEIGVEGRYTYVETRTITIYEYERYFKHYKDQ